MKKLLTIIFTVLSCVAFAQKPVQTLGVKGNIVKVLGQLAGDSAFLFPKDTIQLQISDRAIAFKNDNVYKWTGYKWVFFAAANDTTYYDYPIRVRDDTSTGTLQHHVFILHANGLISGGLVTKAACMSLDVTSPVYVINFIQFIAADTVITVAASDPSLPRTDEVVADTTGRVYILTGVPSPTPVPIGINPSSQIVLSTFTIPAGATCLSIIQKIIYDQDSTGEFSHTTGGTITAAFGNTDNPYHLTKAVFISSYHDGSTTTWTDSGSDTAQLGEVIKHFFYFNGAFGNQIQEQLFNGSTAVTNSIVINPYFNANDSNYYTDVVVPFSAFTFSSPYFNKLVMTYRGNDTSGAKGFYEDYLQLQIGTAQSQTDYSGKIDSVTKFQDSILLNWSKGLVIRKDTFRFNSGGGGTGGISKLGSPAYGLLNPNDSSYVLDTSIHASGSITGLLSNIDWNTFDGKVDSVVGAAPIISSGGNSPIISADTSKLPGRLATYSDVNSKADTLDLVKFNFTGLRQHDLLWYDSVNNKWINFRTVFNAPLSWNYTTGTASVDTSTAITGLTTLYQNSLKLNITDTANIRVRLFAGSNISLTGTYPNITISASGSGGSGGISKLGSPTFGLLRPNDSTYVIDTAGAKATASNSGFLSNIDWNAFNLKVDSVTKNATFDSIYSWSNGVVIKRIRDSIGLTNVVNINYWVKDGSGNLSNTQTGATGNVTVGSATPHGKFQVVNNSETTVAVPDSSGIFIANNTQATSTTLLKQSPALTFKSSGWATTPSRAIDSRIKMYVVPTTSTTGSFPSLFIQTSIDSGITYNNMVSFQGNIMTAGTSTYGGAANITSTLGVTSNITCFKIIQTVAFGTAGSGNLTSNGNAFTFNPAGAGTGIQYGNNTYLGGTINLTAGTANITDLLDSVNETSLTGTVHNAIRTFKGNNILNYGNGNTSIGVSTFGYAPTDKLEVNGNVSLLTAGNKLKITEGSGGSLGQTTLVSGTKAITISGLTTSSRAIVTLVTPTGTSLTTTYQAVCTSNTLTIQANIAAGTINVADGSTLNYLIIN